MELTHHTRAIRIAPRKMRLVIDQFRHQPVDKALELLPLVRQGAAAHVYKSLKAARQAAEDINLDPATLVIQRLVCDEGTALKRMIKHSRGRSSMIMKKYSHLSIVLVGDQRTRTTKKVRAAAPKEEVTEVTEPAVEPTDLPEKE